MTKRAYSLDALRVIAIFWVFICHVLFFDVGLAEDEKMLPDVSNAISNIGACAVHFFIVLSAFLVGYSYEKSISHGYVEYVKKRAKRLLPVNMVILPFYVILLIWVGLHEFAWVRTIGDYILASLLLEEMFRFSTLCFNVPAWTISTLFILYLLTPLLIWPLKKIKNPWILFIFVIILTVADWEYRFGLLMTFPKNTWINYASPINRILSYMEGLTLGYAVRLVTCPDSIRRYAKWMEIIVFGAIICGISMIKSHYMLGNYTLLYSVPALVLVCYVEGGWITRFIASSKISKVSPYVYAFYMSHFFFILMVYAICDKVLGIWGTMSLTLVPILSVAAFIGTCVVTFLLHHYVEKRIA
jgi:peptidoglycan/LPS O-acetylase OafA/YrhL